LGRNRLALSPAEPPQIFTPTPPAPLQWSPIDAPPDKSEADLVTPQGQLRHDPAGTRWIVGRERRAQRARRLDPSPHTSLKWEARQGLVSVGHDRRIRHAKEPLSALIEVGTVPQPIELTTVLRYRGGYSGFGVGGAQISSNGRDWRLPPSFAGRTALQVLIGADGTGIGLFLPQLVATTSDGGASWQRLETGAALVTQLDIRGDVALLPGRLINHARGHSWTAERYSPESGLGSATVSEHAAGLPQSFPIWAKKPSKQVRRGESAEPQRLVKCRYYGGCRSVTIDGDTVVVNVREDRKVEPAARAYKSLRIGQGSIGGALAWRTLGEPGACAAGTLRAIAACDGRVVGSCGSLITLETGQEQISTRAPFAVAALAFASPDRIIAVGEEYGQLAAIEATDDLDDIEPLAIDPVELPPYEHEQLSFVGGCASESDPDSASRRLWLTRLDLVLSLDEQRLSLRAKGKDTAGRAPLGVDRLGRLLLSTPTSCSYSGGSDPVCRQLGRVTPSGFDGVLKLPFVPGARAYLPSLAQGRGLLPDVAGNLWQTTDDGESWAVVQGPVGLTSPRLVLCGANRCEVDDWAVRVGWPSAGPKTPPRTSQWRPRRAKGVAPTDMVLSCHQEPSLSPKLPPGTRLRTIRSGLGEVLWTAAGEQKREGSEPRAEGTVVVVGHLDGTTKQVMSCGRRCLTFVGPVLGQLDADRQLFWVGHDGQSHKGPIPNSSILYEVHSTQGLSFTPNVKAPLITFARDGAVESRAWPAANDLYNVDHSIVEAADGNWIVLGQPGRVSHFDERMDGGERLPQFPARAISLFRLSARDTAPPLTSLRALTTNLQIEHGAELIREGSQTYLAIVESLADGGTELRLRTIAADLTIGGAIAVANTRAPAGQLTPLSNCARGAPGALVSLRAPELGPNETLLDGKRLRGGQLRWVRVHSSGACVERTLLGFGIASDPHEDGYRSHKDEWLILPGDGEGRGVLVEEMKLIGVRCKREPRRPSPPSSP